MSLQGVRKKWHLMYVFCGALLCPVYTLHIYFYITSLQTHVEYMQFCVGKCLIKANKQKPWFVLFVNLYGTNTPTITNFKLPKWCHYVRSWGEMHTIGCQELVLADSITPLSIEGLLVSSFWSQGNWYGEIQWFIWDGDAKNSRAVT